MKKNYFSLAVLFTTLLLVSCTNEESIDSGLSDNSPAELQFRLANSDYSEQTRATSETTTSIRGKNFNLVASGVSGGTFNHKMLVATNGSTATIDETTPPTYYWPAYIAPGTIDMKFVGAYPYNAGWTGNTTTPSLTRSGYTVGTTFASMEDLLYTYKNITSRTASAPSAVTLVFNHALVKVTFSLKLTSNTSAVDVYVKNITLSNLKNQGTCTLNPTTTSASPATIWSAQAGGVSVALTNLTKTTHATVFKAVNAASPANIFNSAWASGDHYILMPVNGHPSSVGLSITFNVGGVDYVKTATLPSTAAELTALGIASADVAARQWYPGRHINYQLQYDVDKEGGELVFGGITVANWGDVQNIPVPLN